MIVRAIILGAICATPFALVFGDTVGVGVTLVVAAAIVMGEAFGGER